MAVEEALAMDSLRQDLRLTTIVVAVASIIVFLMVNAVGKNSVVLNGSSAVLYCAVICFGTQWAAWVPASILKTERFYDLMGGLTYLAAVGFSLWAGAQSEAPSVRELIISFLVVIWSLRLSSFLYFRIHRTGKDGRFDPTQNIADPVSYPVDPSSPVGVPHNDRRDRHQQSSRFSTSIRDVGCGWIFNMDPRVWH